MSQNSKEQEFINFAKKNLCLIPFENLTVEQNAEFVVAANKVWTWIYYEYIPESDWLLINKKQEEKFIPEKELFNLFLIWIKDHPVWDKDLEKWIKTDPAYVDLERILIGGGEKEKVLMIMNRWFEKKESFINVDLIPKEDPYRKQAGLCYNAWLDKQEKSKSDEQNVVDIGTLSQSKAVAVMNEPTNRLGLFIRKRLKEGPFYAHQMFHGQIIDWVFGWDEEKSLSLDAEKVAEIAGGLARYSDGKRTAALIYNEWLKEKFKGTRSWDTPMDDPETSKFKLSVKNFVRNILTNNSQTGNPFGLEFYHSIDSDAQVKEWQMIINLVLELVLTKEEVLVINKSVGPGAENWKKAAIAIYSRWIISTIESGQQESLSNVSLPSKAVVAYLNQELKMFALRKLNDGSYWANQYRHDFIIQKVNEFDNQKRPEIDLDLVPSRFTNQSYEVTAMLIYNQWIKFKRQQETAKALDENEHNRILKVKDESMKESELGVSVKKFMNKVVKELNLYFEGPEGFEKAFDQIMTWIKNEIKLEDSCLTIHHNPMTKMESDKNIARTIYGNWLNQKEKEKKKTMDKFQCFHEVNGKRYFKLNATLFGQGINQYLRYLSPEIGIPFGLAETEGIFDGRINMIYSWKDILEKVNTGTYFD